MTEPLPDAGDEEILEIEQPATSPETPKRDESKPLAEQEPSHDDSRNDADDDATEEDTEEEDDDEEDDEDDEEPRLKYARLTQHLGPVYRNADATSSFLVAGDKMVLLGASSTESKTIANPWYRLLAPITATSYVYLSLSHASQWLTEHAACYSTTDIPNPTSLPCPFRLRYQRLHIPLSATRFDLEARSCQPSHRPSD